MAKKIYPLIILLILFVGCKKNPTSSDVSYSLEDLVGTWIGSVSNSSNNIDLNLNVDSDGKVSGSGVNSTWSINSNGKVSGGGSFSFVSGNYLTVAGASWSLQLSSSKEKLTGEFNVAYSTLHDMDVDLIKQ